MSIKDMACIDCGILCCEAGSLYGSKSGQWRCKTHHLQETQRLATLIKNAGVAQ